MKLIMTHFYHRPLKSIFSTKREKERYQRWRNLPETEKEYQQAALLKRAAEPIIAPQMAAIRRCVATILKGFMAESGANSASRTSQTLEALEGSKGSKDLEDLKSLENLQEQIREDLEYLFIFQSIKRDIPLITSLKTLYKLPAE